MMVLAGMSLTVAATEIASGQFGDCLDTGMPGAEWVLQSNGVLTVDSGFIEWDGRDVLIPNPVVYSWESPWVSHALDINEIVFTGSVTAGETLNGLFGGLFFLADIEGLYHFNLSNTTDISGMFWYAWDLRNLNLSYWYTANITDMSGMFAYTNRLISLDLSNWDTSNVTDMGSMFFASGVSEIDVSHFDTSEVTNMSFMFFDTRATSLDLSNWDTSNVTNMSRMFDGMQRLHEISLGENFNFVGGTSANLPWVSNDSQFTGRWQNVGAGTVNNPQGEFAFTALELMENYDGSTMADTWVWQPVRMNVFEITSFEVLNGNVYITAINTMSVDQNLLLFAANYDGNIELIGEAFMEPVLIPSGISVSIAPIALPDGFDGAKVMLWDRTFNPIVPYIVSV